MSLAVLVPTPAYVPLLATRAKDEDENNTLVEVDIQNKNKTWYRLVYMDQLV